MIFISILLCGCKKDEVVAPTTFQIKNGFTIGKNTNHYYSNNSSSYIYAANMDQVIIYCYNAKDEMVSSKDVTEILKGITSTALEVASDIVKVRVTTRFYGVSSSNVKNYYEESWPVGYSTVHGQVFYVQTYFYLTKSSNTIITINDNTVVRNANYSAWN